MDLVSVAPISPFKAPLFKFVHHAVFSPDFTTPNGAFSTQSVVSGFMPAIFYSIEKNGEIRLFSLIVDFIQSIDLKDFKATRPVSRSICGACTPSALS